MLLDRPVTCRGRGGSSTRPTSRSRVAGSTCTGRSISTGRSSTSWCRRGATPTRRGRSSPERCTRHLRRSRSPPTGRRSIHVCSNRSPAPHGTSPSSTRTTIEADHGRLKARLRPMRGLKCARFPTDCHGRSRVPAEPSPRPLRTHHRPPPEPVGPRRVPRTSRQPVGATLRLPAAPRRRRSINATEPSGLPWTWSTSSICHAAHISTPRTRRAHRRGAAHSRRSGTIRRGGRRGPARSDSDRRRGRRRYPPRTERAGEPYLVPLVLAPAPVAPDQSSPPRQLAAAHYETKAGCTQPAAPFPGRLERRRAGPTPFE
jgi:hypothetical protein